eukprot:gene18273-24726_t
MPSSSGPAFISTAILIAAVVWRGQLLGCLAPKPNAVPSAVSALQELKDAFALSPNNGTMVLQLANAYRDLRDYDEAVLKYIQHIKLRGDEEEMFVSAYTIALMVQLKFEANETLPAILAEHLVSWSTTNWGDDPLEHVLNAYLAASQEPNFKLALAYRLQHEDFYRCSAYAVMGRAQGPPHKKTLFPEMLIYDYYMLEEICVCGFYTRKRLWLLLLLLFLSLAHT